jgi:hypothetical protein
MFTSLSDRFDGFYPFFVRVSLQNPMRCLGCVSFPQTMAYAAMRIMKKQTGRLGRWVLN